jgi:GntR family transcriptional regulator, transcriptional repressor for pyruvate dehydrogenase complex
MTSSQKTTREVRPIDGLTSELVVAHIRRLILNRELKRGARLPPERELVRSLGVSRTSVRGGLQALVAKGVLVTRHGAGTFVADGPPVLDSEPLNFLAALHGFTPSEMFEARLTLEVGVAGLAADRATGEALAAMSEEVMGMFASISDPQTFLVHDIRFHRAIAAASNNPILASIVDMVSTLFYEQRRRTADLARDPRSVAEMHRQIYQAIRSHDRPRAQALMFEHLSRAEREQESERAGELPPAAGVPKQVPLADGTVPGGLHK